MDIKNNTKLQNAVFALYGSYGIVYMRVERRIRSIVFLVFIEYPE